MFTNSLNELSKVLAESKIDTDDPDVLDYKRGLLPLDFIYRGLGPGQCGIKMSANSGGQTFQSISSSHLGPIFPKDLLDGDIKPQRSDPWIGDNVNRCSRQMVEEQQHQEADRLLRERKIRPFLDKLLEHEEVDQISTALCDCISEAPYQSLELKFKHANTSQFAYDTLTGELERVDYNVMPIQRKQYEGSAAKTQNYHGQRISNKFENSEEKVSLAQSAIGKVEINKELSQLGQSLKEINETTAQEDDKGNLSMDKLVEVYSKTVNFLEMPTIEKIKNQDTHPLKRKKKGPADAYQEYWEEILQEIDDDTAPFRIDDTKFQSLETAKGQREFEKSGLQVEKILSTITERIKKQEEQQQNAESEESAIVVKKQSEDLLDTENKFKMIVLTNLQSRASIPKNSKHASAIEDNMDLTNFSDWMPSEKFAMTFSFELDDFQKRAILHLERGESVLVSAHTSAGKTVVAEYAIALAQRHKRKAVYTSPIKALSNEKYRKFSRKFMDVGILTGDVTLNATAACLIMTTEILRNMLYKGSDIIRDIEWVIFDEVHYVNNIERGVVWEETIIMLPEHIGIVMLSATVPNYMDFANWVGRTKNRKIYVEKTFTRSVPLEHTIFMLEKFHLIKEENGSFKKEAYDQLKRAINETKPEHLEIVQRTKQLKLEKQQAHTFKDHREPSKLFQSMKVANEKYIKNISSKEMQNPQLRDEKRGIAQLIRHCKREGLLPAVVFIFSKAKIINLSEGLLNLDLITKKQQGEITRYVTKCLKKLKPEDQQLNQLIDLKNLLSKGIAIHHGDLLPIAKEIVEILFSEGLIQVLLATETFAMGINMPAKTVIFHSLKKSDGREFRFLNSSEYTQMAGRAGRRGIDQKGNVVIYVNNPEQLPDKAQMSKIVDHPGEQLQSKFRITYPIILNLLNSEELNVTDMMKRSFSENSRLHLMKTRKEAQEKLEQDLLTTSQFDCPYVLRSMNIPAPIEDFYVSSSGLRYNNQQMCNSQQTIRWLQPQLPKFIAVLDQNNYIIPAILYGIETGDQPFEILIVNDVSSMANEDKAKRIKLTYEEQSSHAKAMPVRGTTFVLRTLLIKATEVLAIFKDPVKMENKRPNYDKRDSNDKDDLARILIEKSSNWNPDRIFDKNEQKSKEWQLEKLTTNLANIEFGEVLENRKTNLNNILESKCYNCEKKEEHIEQYIKLQILTQQISKLSKEIDENELKYNDDFLNRCHVLQELRYINENNTPLIKARVAREIGENSIYICEVLVENLLDDLNPEEIATLLSGFTCQFKRKESQPVNSLNMDHFSPRLVAAADKAYNLSRSIAIIERENNAADDCSLDEYLSQIINFSLAEVVYSWTSGRNFVDVCSMTEAREGEIVKTILRLDNLLRDLKSAARIIGQAILIKKLEIIE